MTAAYFWCSLLRDLSWRGNTVAFRKIKSQFLLIKMKTNFEGEWNSLRLQRIHSRIQLIYVPIKFDNAADATCVSWLFSAFYTKPALCRRSSKSDKIAKQIDWYNRKLDSKRFTTRLTLDQSCYYSVLPTNFFSQFFCYFPPQYGAVAHRVWNMTLAKSLSSLSFWINLDLK